MKIVLVALLLLPACVTASDLHAMRTQVMYDVESGDKTAGEAFADALEDKADEINAKVDATLESTSQRDGLLGLAGLAGLHLFRNMTRKKAINGGGAK